MAKFKTEQEKFWAGGFGDEYAKRNRGEKFISNQINYFSKILDHTDSIKSVLELGANIGENLKAIKQLIPDADLCAVEINKSAAQEIKKWKEGKVKVLNQSILDFKIDKKRDFIFVKGVLIHINPDELLKVYEKMYNASSRYVCIGEYYNPTPIGVNYRGNEDRLFKRDFCGEIMKKYPNLKLKEYGFAYHMDNNFPQDDITWFLLEKKNK